MLDHLAECGHVQRTRAADDRRVVVTCLTPQGESKVQSKRATWQARWEQALADVDAEESAGRHTGPGALGDGLRGHAG